MNVSIFLSSHDHYEDLRDYSFAMSFKYSYGLFILIQSDLDVTKLLIAITSSCIIVIYSVVADYESRNDYLKYAALPNMLFFGYS